MAIRAALAGGSFLSPQITRAVIDDYVRRGEDPGRGSKLDQITPREREVLQLLAEGLSNQAIARQLSISVKTVESHRSSIMSKLGLSNKTELVRFALRQGWATLEE
jgi:DNA-binding NarL/FixJ family response regulator